MSVSGGVLAQAAVELVADGRLLRGGVAKAINGAGSEAEKAGAAAGGLFGKSFLGKVKGVALYTGIHDALQMTIGALGGGVKSVITTGVEYQAAMANLAAVTRSSGEQMALAGELAQRLGRDMRYPGITAAQVAAAMVDLANAGFDLRSSMAATPAVLQLVTASGLDTARVAQFVGDSLDIFALKADQAGGVADVLASAIHNTSGGLEEFFTGLKYVGPVAAAMRVDLHETATVMAELGRAGIIGSMAGTGLRSMLVSLAHPSTQARAALTALGVEAFDASGRFVGFRAVIEQLSHAQEHMSEQQFAAAAATAFGQEALSGVVALAHQGAAGFDRMSTALAHQGAAAELASAKTVGLGATIGNLKKVGADVALSIFQAVSPSLERVGNSLVGGLANAGPLLAGVLRPVMAILAELASVAMTLLVPALALVQPLFGALAVVVGNPVFGVFAAALAGAAAGMLALRAPVLLVAGAVELWTLATRAAAAAQVALNLAMDANPIGLLVIGIGALVAAVLYLWSASAPFREFWVGLWTTVSSAVGVAVDWVSGAFQALVGWFRSLPAEALLAVPVIGQLAYVLLKLPTIIDAICAAGRAVLDFFAGLPQRVADGACAVGSAVAGGFQVAVDWVAGLPGRIGPALLAGLRAGADAAVQGVEWIIAELIVLPVQVGLLLARAGQALVGWAVALPGQILAGLGALVGMLAEAARSAWTWYVTTTITTALAVVAWALGLPGRIVAGVQALAGMLAEAASSAWTGFVTASVSAGSSVLSWVVGLPGQVVGGLGALAGLLGSAASAAWNNFVEGSVSAATGLWAWISSVPGRIRDALGDLGGLLWGAGRAIIDGLLSGLRSAIGAVWDFVGGIADKIRQLKGPLPYDRQLLVPAGRAIVGGLDRGLRAEFGTVRATLRAFTREIPNFEVPVHARATTTFSNSDNGFARVTAGSTGPVTHRQVTVHAPITVQPVAADPLLVALRAADHVAALAQA
ncbi:hypothetical protein GCM10010174_25750 [Kutzneria viridogrisea]|uniref:TP901 family phage tail tape measure protein n=1 Tax=Kutzneria viridogrisea TaxID=47990 RepID=A0ABR6BRE3_9PSEU|nr:TP901 family phage tail tape measure protein [Kutzneria viridogrisea]